MSTLYLCKQCGAQSPAGIGYAANGQSEFPQPDPACPNLHVEAATGGACEPAAPFKVGDRAAGLFLGPRGTTLAPMLVTSVQADYSTALGRAEYRWKVTAVRADGETLVETGYLVTEATSGEHLSRADALTTDTYQLFGPGWEALESRYAGCVVFQGRYVAPGEAITFTSPATGSPYTVVFISLDGDTVTFRDDAGLFQRPVRDVSAH